MINNYEKQDTYGTKFYKATDDEVIKTLNANTLPMAYLTNMLGSEMKNKERQGGKKCAIISMTSAISNYPLSSLPVYSFSGLSSTSNNLFGFLRKIIPVFPLESFIVLLLFFKFKP